MNGVGGEVSEKEAEVIDTNQSEESFVCLARVFRLVM